MGVVCRAVFLQHKSSGLMDNDDLQRLWGVLEEKYTPPLVGEDQVSEEELVDEWHYLPTFR